jgi:hypothetical protein
MLHDMTKREIESEIQDINLKGAESGVLSESSVAEEPEEEEEEEEDEEEDEARDQGENKPEEATEKEHVPPEPETGVPEEAPAAMLSPAAAPVGAVELMSQTALGGPQLTMGI